MNGYAWDGSDLIVDLAKSGIAVTLVDAVVDLDEFGDAIGVEILGLLARHPLLPDFVNSPTCKESNMQVSCDPSADALYIRFADGRSLDQVVRSAIVVLGPNDALVKIVVRME